MAYYELRRMKIDGPPRGSEFFEAPNDEAAIAKAMQAEATAADGIKVTLFTGDGHQRFQLYPRRRRS